MPTTRAKFSVTGKACENEGTENEYWLINLHPVSGGSEENESFFKWTPGGNITLSTINPAAANGFEVGKEYYVDFTEAE